VWLPPWLVPVPRAHQNDIRDRFSFCVKSGLVIELFFRVSSNDGLRSFVGWPVFIFSPSPLGSTWVVMLAMLILSMLPIRTIKMLKFCSVLLWAFVVVVLDRNPKTSSCLCRYRAPQLLRIENFDWAGQPCVAPLNLAPHYIVHLLLNWWGRHCFSCERWVGNWVGFSGLPQEWPSVICRGLIFIFSPYPLSSTWVVMLAMLVLGGICEQFSFYSKFLELYGLLWCGSLWRIASSLFGYLWCRFLVLVLFLCCHCQLICTHLKRDVKGFWL